MGMTSRGKSVTQFLLLQAFRSLFLVSGSKDGIACRTLRSNSVQILESIQVLAY